MAKRGRKRKGLFHAIRLKPNTIRTIFFVFFAMLTTISILSFLQKGSKLIELNQLLNLYFGFFSLLVPFLLLLLTFTFIKSKIPLKEPTIFIGFIFIFVSFLSLFQSGIVGEFLWNQLLTLFGQAGTLIIYIFCLIVGIVVLFDTNIIDIFRTISKTLKAIKKYTIGTGLKVKKFNSNKIYRNDSKPPVQPRASSATKEDMSYVGIPPILKEIKDIEPANIDLKNNTLGQTQIWQYPSVSVFDNSPGAPADRGDVGKNAHIIEETLDSFGITAKVVEINDSPSVTQYALEVALGTKLAKIVSLSNDLAMALSAPGGQIRIEAPIPGRSFVGIEVPNRSLQVVPIRKILENDTMKSSKSKISVPLGLDVAGKAKITDINKMPHILICGQTNSGKSVCINSWICTLLFRSSPDEVKLILVDPKRVELTPYNDIPHLLQPVIVEPEKVLAALKWAVSEMENRYKQLTEAGVRNIDSFNEKSGFVSMPYIIIIVDELNDIMMSSPTEVEEAICRIAQMARAVGIHLVLATQRPSVNVITGLIKANIPARIAFAVSSMMDSRVILDTPGAEKLLGRGDMLFIPPDLAKPVRIQGCFVSDKERDNLIDFVKKQRSPTYNNDVVSQQVAIRQKGGASGNTSSDDRDQYFDDAVKAISESGIASTSFLQRRLKLGYARAARIVDQLEKAGVVGPSKGAKPRDILVPHNTSSNTEF